MSEHNPTTHLTYQPGDVIEPFTITKQIGAGGSSVVFKAHDTLLDRDVAIKQMIPPQGSDDEAFRERFRREVKAHKQAAAASTDRLLQPIDAKETDRGCLLITEYVSGASLEQILSRDTGPMSVNQALGIIAATGLGLKAVHDAGLLHRDLKPANILMPRGGGLKLSDFGLASAMGDQAQMDAGTVRYMAPELLQGETADARADLYALGLIAYEMIAGRAKFDEAFRAIVRDQRNPAMRWIKWHTNPRTAAPPLTELIHGTPQAISDLVARLMEKDPAKRVPDADALLQAIQRYHRGETVNPEPGDAEPAAATSTPGDTAPLPKAGGVNKLLLTAVLVLLLALLGVGGYALFAPDGDQPSEQQAYDTFDQASAAADAGEYDRALELYDGLADRWRADTRVGEIARAGMMLTQGRIALEDGEYDRAIEQLQAYDQTGFGQRDTTRRLIDEARHRRDFDRAMAELEQLIDDDEFTQARNLIRDWHELDLTLTEAEQSRLREVSDRLEDQQARARVDQILGQAQSQLERGDREAAIQTLTDAIAARPDRRLQDRLDELQQQANRDQALTRATTAEEQGDLDAAIAALNQAQEIRRVPATADRLARIQSERALQQGLALLEQANAAEAEAALTRSINFRDNPRARQALQRIESTSEKSSFIAAGDEAVAKNDYDSAVNAYENAIEIANDAETAEKLEQARMQRSIQRGLQALAEQQTDQAERFLAEARRLAPDHPAVQQAMGELQTLRQYQDLIDAGDAARERSDFGDAKARYRRAAEVLDTAEARQRLQETEYDHLVAQARTYMSAEEYRSAQGMLRIALDIQDSEEVRDLLSQVSEQLQE